MDRLTKEMSGLNKHQEKVYTLKDLYGDGKIEGVFNRLAEYENTGLSPQEIEQLKQQVPKKGKWEKGHEDSSRYRCSVCGTINNMLYILDNFCLDCGSDMRK